MTQTQTHSEPLDGRERHAEINRLMRIDGTPLDVHLLGRVEAYLECAGDIAFLAYRRRSMNYGAINWVMEPRLYAEWQAVGDAMFLVRALAQGKAVDVRYRKGTK